MNKTLKILIINYEFPPLGGGGGVATYDLAIEWAKYARVDVLTSTYKDLARFEKVHDINVHRVKVLFRKSRDAATFLSMLTYLPAALFKGISLIRKNRYDVINTHFAVPSGPVGYILSKLFRIPNVLSIHGGDIYDPSKKMSPHKNIIWKKVVQFILNKADTVVAQSNNTRDNANKYYKIKQDISIIPLPFHIPPKPENAGLKLNKNDFNIVTIGRLIKRKAFDMLIESLAMIDNKKIKLFIIGDGPEKPYLESVIAENGLEDRVTLLGFVDDNEKFSYISHSDLFALSSLHEGFGIVFMEAMYFGLPIVCTNHGGQVDFIKNNQNGILIDVGDRKACSNAILKLYDNDTLYNKCSRNNRKEVKNFLAENVAKQYTKIYTSFNNDRK